MRKTSETYSLFAAGGLVAVALATLARGAPQTLPPGPTPEDEAGASAAWAEVLERYVDDLGRVDFAGLSENREGIEAYLRWVARADESRMGRAERVAFHVNAYNALAMYGVVRAGIPESFDGLWAKVRFFVVPKYEVAGRRLSLYGLENRVIRKEADARAHVVLNCMSRSCPRLPREPFRAGTFGLYQLDREARRFYNEERNVRIDHAGRTVRLSKILGLYTRDFLGEAPSLIAYVNRYREDKLPEGYLVEFVPYDWTLNRQPDRSP